jgi:hypothetical protein
MQMLYNSDSFVVVEFDVPRAEGLPEDTPTRGGYEIVDKTSRKEIFIEGALAERFKLGVQALVDEGSSTEEAFDEYIAGFTGLAQQPVILH